MAGAPDLHLHTPSTPLRPRQKTPDYLADRLGFPALFLLAAGLYALPLYAGRRLPEEG
ncbi:hypothetical protein [Thermus thermophilus]|uniref:hypothetical protein n=1 Tax=Thermus thermophilus TaxID=274 RepID=UPI0003A38414|nr:hypothetical protein [Thermus thermophilus]